MPIHRVKVVNISTVTLEFKKGVCEIFAILGKKVGNNWHIPLNISANTGQIGTVRRCTKT